MQKHICVPIFLTFKHQTLLWSAELPWGLRGFGDQSDGRPFKVNNGQTKISKNQGISWGISFNCSTRFRHRWKRRMPANRWKNSLHANEVNDDPVSQLCHYACPWLSHCNGIHGLQHSSARHLWKLPALLVVWWSFYSRILAARLSHPHFNSHQTRKWFWASEGKGFLMNSSQLSIISIRVDTCRAFSHDLSSPTKAAFRTGTQGVEVCVNPQVLKFKCQKDPKSAIISIINYNNQD